MKKQAAALALGLGLTLTACTQDAGETPDPAPSPAASAERTPSGEAPSPGAETVRTQGDDPAWCGPIVTYFDTTVTREREAGNDLEDPAVLGEVRKNAAASKSAAGTPDLPESIKTYLTNAAALNERIAETQGKLGPADVAVAQETYRELVATIEKVNTECPETIKESKTAAVEEAPSR